jgi:hypothetical protein
MLPAAVRCIEVRRTAAIEPGALSKAQFSAVCGLPIEHDFLRFHRLDR